MYLADFHIHSNCSFDASNTMTEMAIASMRRGVTHICFTDHADLDYTETLVLGPDRFEIPEVQLRQYEEALRHSPKELTIGLGLELGEANHHKERALRIYDVAGYDFILGSLHNLEGREDFFFVKYESLEHCYALYDHYLDELIDLAAMPCFDVMAHIGYCLRYMSKAGFDAELTLERNGEKIDTLLRTLIYNGRGIELNCADLVPGGRDGALLVTIPSIAIIKRYRELGGEIITVGTDAHTTRAAGLGLSEGYQLLRDNGFKYATVFRQHKPEFIKI